MFGAVAFDLYKCRSLISADDVTVIAVGLVASFLVAMLVVRFVGRHGFSVFAWYRIAAGSLALGLLAIAG